MALDATIIFPNLGITIENLVSGFYIGDFYIAFYGVIIAASLVLAVVISMIRAKRTNQDSDNYLDIGIVVAITGIIGARLYYVLFSLDQYDSLWDVLNIRQGGIAIYGGLIGGVIGGFVACKIKKISFLRGLDTAAPGIVLAQAIGRWGNFFNMEAYGDYTDSLFAMQIKYSEAGGVITQSIEDNLVYVDGTAYIQVHPTFLYESAWCLLVFILLLVFDRFRQYNGEQFLWYIGAYALERAFVEGLRTDQLQIGSTGIAVSQVLSVAIVAASFCILLINRIRIAKKLWDPKYSRILPDGAPGTRQFSDERAFERKNRKKNKWESYTVDKAGSAVADAEETSAGKETESADAAKEPCADTCPDEEAAISKESESADAVKEPCADACPDEETAISKESESADAVEIPAENPESNQ